MVLVTGPIWAKPVWFVWWTWSPRLTSSLILCLLYVAYLLIRNYIEDPERKAMVQRSLESWPLSMRRWFGFQSAGGGISTRPRCWNRRLVGLHASGIFDMLGSLSGSPDISPPPALYLQSTQDELEWIERQADTAR